PVTAYRSAEPLGHHCQSRVTRVVPEDVVVLAKSMNREHPDPQRSPIAVIVQDPVGCRAAGQPGDLIAFKIRSHSGRSRPYAFLGKTVAGGQTEAAHE